MFVPPEHILAITNAAVRDGDGDHLRSILNQYDKSAVNLITIADGDPIIAFVFIARRIGIARILINEYDIDPNCLDQEGNPHFLRLFVGADSSEACQSLLINAIKEFKLNVHIRGPLKSAIHCAVLQKLLQVLKFLVEECKVDVNQTIGMKPIIGGTALHMAYGMDDLNVAKYLIEHGANQNALDTNGNKPEDCRCKINYYSLASKYFIKYSKIFHNVASKEREYFSKSVRDGISVFDAVDLTIKQFPKLMEDGSTNPHNLEAIPTMSKLNRYVTDMAPSYYAIGLELDIPNSKLKVIKADPSLGDLEEKCRKMMEVWLENDTSATWRKLYDALQEPDVGLCTIAEQIKKSV